MNFPNSLIVYSLTAFSLAAQTAQIRWDVQQDRPVAHDVYVWQGETVDLMPRLVQGTAPVAVTNAPVEFRYREAALATNQYRTVAASSDTNSGVLSVRWTPDYDAGAAWYDYQVIVGSNAVNPRAFGRITMRPTIGCPASTNPPPPVTLYPSRADLQATSNALAEAVQAESQARASTNALFAAWFGSLFNSTSRWDAAYAWGDWHSAVAACATNPVTRLYATAGTTVMDLSNSVPRIFEAGMFTNWTVALSSDFSPRPWAGTSPHAFPFESGDWVGYFDNTGSAVISYLFATVVWQSPVGGGLASPQQVEFNDNLSDGDGAGYATVAATTYTRKETAEVLTDLSGYKQMAGTEIGSGSITFAPDMNASITISHGGVSYYSLAAGMIDFLWPSDSGTLATTQDVAKAIAAIPAPDLSGLATTSALAEATNRIVQTYILTTNAWMSISNSVLSITIITNGVTNVVWSSAESAGGLDPSFSNAVWSAMSGLTSALGEKLDRAWGQYAPDGSANPDPEYMTFLNAPATVFASGCAWSTCGTYAVLTATGTVAFASGGDGQFRLGPNSTNWFGFIQGGSVTVGAVAESLAVAAGGTAEGIATIVYPYSGGDFPALWFSPSLGAVDFATVEGVVWVDNQNGTATVTAPSTTEKGFWYATTTATFDNVFESTMPARFSGGILGTTNALPVIYDSVIKISSGGHTYRIPAQLAD